MDTKSPPMMSQSDSFFHTLWPFNVWRNADWIVSDSSIFSSFKRQVSQFPIWAWWSASIRPWESRNSKKQLLSEFITLQAVLHPFESIPIQCFVRCIYTPWNLFSIRYSVNSTYLIQWHLLSVLYSTCCNYIKFSIFHPVKYIKNCTLGSLFHFFTTQDATRYDWLLIGLMPPYYIWVVLTRHGACIHAVCEVFWLNTVSEQMLFFVCPARIQSPNGLAIAVSI